MLKRIFCKLFQNKNQTWTFYAQIAKLLSGFAFIGVLARMLPSDLLGTWYIFVSLFGVTSLVEMGLGQVIGRHAAYLKADYDLGRISSADFLKFAKIGERFYIFLSLLIGILAFVAGFWWLKLKPDWQSPYSLTLAWSVYVLGGMLTILGAYYAALVNGSGEMWKTQRAAICASTLSICVLLTMLFFPRSLLIPSTAMLLSQLLLITLLRHAFQKLDIIKNAVLINHPTILNTTLTIQKIAKDASKMLLIMVYYQLLTNGFVLVLSKYLDIHEIGSYGLTMQLVGVVMSLSMIWSQSSFFEMAAIQQSGDNRRLQSIFLSNLIRALGVSMVGMLAIFFLAPYTLTLWGAKTNLLEPLELSVLLGCIWVEFGLTQFSQMLIAKGDMRVAYYSFFAAIAICGSGLILLSKGYFLIYVLVSRLAWYVCIIGIPVLIISFKALKNGCVLNKEKHEVA